MNLHRFSPLMSLAALGTLFFGLDLSIAQETTSKTDESSMKYPETQMLDVVDD